MSLLVKVASSVKRGFLQLWTLVLFLVYLTITELLDAVGVGSRLETLVLRRSPQRVAG